MTLLSYEESVQWLRNQPKYNDLVKLCYLDIDNYEAAKRFSESDEFTEIKKILKLDHQLQPLKILDIGCGNGIASYAMASLGHTVTATDPDLSKDVGLGAVQRLSSHLFKSGAGSISAIQAFAEALPFPDSTFDLVYARQALHHFSDLYQGLDECSRVLKTNGLFLATREHVVTDEKQLQEFLDNHILQQLHGGENAHTLDTYVRTLRHTKFKRIKVLKTFDTIINHFPVSDADIKRQVSQSLERKFGKRVGSILSGLPSIEKIYRYRLSQTCSTPGRLYSFLCHK